MCAVKITPENVVWTPNW